MHLLTQTMRTGLSEEDVQSFVRLQSYRESPVFRQSYLRERHKTKSRIVALFGEQNISNEFDLDFCEFIVKFASEETDWPELITTLIGHLDGSQPYWLKIKSLRLLKIMAERSSPMLSGQLVADGLIEAYRKTMNGKREENLKPETAKATVAFFVMKAKDDGNVFSDKSVYRLGRLVVNFILTKMMNNIGRRVNDDLWGQIDDGFSQIGAAPSFYEGLDMLKELVEGLGSAVLNFIDTDKMKEWLSYGDIEIKHSVLIFLPMALPRKSIHWSENYFVRSFHNSLVGSGIKTWVAMRFVHLSYLHMGSVNFENDHHSLILDNLIKALSQYSVPRIQVQAAMTIESFCFRCIADGLSSLTKYMDVLVNALIPFAELEVYQYQPLSPHMRFVLQTDQSTGINVHFLELKVICGCVLDLLVTHIERPFRGRVNKAIEHAMISTTTYSKEVAKYYMALPLGDADNNITLLKMISASGKILQASTAIAGRTVKESLCDSILNNKEKLPDHAWKGIEPHLKF